MQLREHLVLPRGEVIHDVPEPMRVPRESPTIPGPDRTRSAFGNSRHLHYSMPVMLPRSCLRPGQIESQTVSLHGFARSSAMGLLWSGAQHLRRVLLGQIDAIDSS